MTLNNLFPKLHRIQWLILRKMIIQEMWGFNEIKFEDMDPKKFTYHLKQLQKEELVGYDSSIKKYFLDANGKILMDYFRNMPNFAELPINTSVLLYIKRGGKILAVKRTRVPSLHFVGNPTSNTSVSEPMLVTAQKLLSSFELKGKLDLALVLEMLYKTKNNDPFTHELFFTYYSGEVNGNCVKKCGEGDLMWLSPEDLLKVKKGYSNTKDIVRYFENPRFKITTPSFIQKSYQKVF